MKTGKLFAGVALATLTAACTNEVMQLEPQAPEAGNRPMVNVQLSFDEDAVEMGKTDTRLTFENGKKGYQWYFKDDDKIGALLMDEWDGQNPGCGIEHFKLVDYVHTNYAFIRKTKDGETKWVTPEQAPVCEGNYFFYFPYNNNFAHRGYVAWDINPVQPQYTHDEENSEEDGKLFQMQAVKDNQKWIGYKFVSHELQGKVNKVDFDFVPVFAMSAFHFINHTAGNLKVNKVVVRCTSNTTPEINPSGTHELMATTMALTPATRGFSSWKYDQGKVINTWDSKSYEQKTAEMWQKAQSYTYVQGADEVYTWPCDEKGENTLGFDIKGKSVFPLNANHSDASIKRVPTYEYVADFSGVDGGYWVGYDREVQAMLVMPAGMYAYGNGQTFEAYVYVTTEEGNNYYVRFDLGTPQTQGATNTSKHDGIITDGATKYLKPGVVTNFKGSFTNDALQSYEITDAKPVSTNDLIWILNEAKDGSDAIKDLCVTTSGKRVELDDSVATLLKDMPKIRLHVNGTISITAKDEEAINLLYFDNPNMKTDLVVTTKQVRRPQVIVDKKTNAETIDKTLGNCQITVNEGAELVTVVNNEEAKEFSSAVTIVADVINYGTIFAGEITGEVTNNGTLKGYQYNKKHEAVNCVVVNASGKDVVNKGVMNAKSIQALKVTNSNSLTVTEAINATTVNNNAGYLKAKGIKAAVDNISDSGRKKLAELETTEDGIVGSVNNTGKLTTQEVGGALTNNITDKVTGSGVASIDYATYGINNHGTLTLNGSGDNYNGLVTNKGTLNIKGNSKFSENLTNYSTLNVEANAYGNVDVENKDEDTAHPGNGGKIIISAGKTFEFNQIVNDADATITVGKGAFLKKQTTNNGTINNSGYANNITNNGTIYVQDAEANTVVIDGEGTVDNSACGTLIVKTGVDQTIKLKVNATGLALNDLKNKINKSSANQLEITGEMNLGNKADGDAQWYVRDGNGTFFSKGAILDGVTISGNNLLAIYADGVTVKNKVNTTDNAEAAFMKDSAEGTTMNLVAGSNLIIQGGTTVRGGQPTTAALILKGDGFIYKSNTGKLLNYKPNPVWEKDHIFQMN